MGGRGDLSHWKTGSSDNMVPKTTGNSQEWEMERAERNTDRVSRGNESTAFLCWRSGLTAFLSVWENRTFALSLSFFLLLTLGLYAVVFQVGFIPSCGAGHVSGCQREPCDVNPPPPPSTPTTTQSPQLREEEEGSALKVIWELCGHKERQVCICLFIHPFSWSILWLHLEMICVLSHSRETLAEYYKNVLHGELSGWCNSESKGLINDLANKPGSSQASWNTSLYSPLPQWLVRNAVEKIK